MAIPEVIFYKSLLDLADLASALGKSTDAVRYLNAADEVKNAINGHLWDSALGAYIDRRPPHRNIGHLANFPCVEQSLNAFALLFDITDREHNLKIQLNADRLGLASGETWSVRNCLKEESAEISFFKNLRNRVLLYPEMRM
ncbi:MAG: hypothetical protein J7M27_05150 [Candidatus Latescibacteria bacterium]|nr:hypothetical protein [Candidatus Latescibacterota bacterium]